MPKYNYYLYILFALSTCHKGFHLSVYESVILWLSKSMISCVNVSKKTTYILAPG